MSKFGWDLPPGCTLADIDRAFGADEMEDEIREVSLPQPVWDLLDQLAPRQGTTNDLILSEMVGLLRRCGCMIAQQAREIMEWKRLGRTK